MERKFNMKIYIVLLVLMVSCNNYSKKEEEVKTPGIFERECSCINDFSSGNSFNENRYTILTNVNFENKDSHIFITGNCADVIRKYISDPNGEYETENVACVSKDQIKLEITDSTKFHIYVSGPDVLNNKEGRKYFLNQLIQNKKAIFQVEVEKKKNVVLMISRMEYLEKTK